MAAELNPATSVKVLIIDDDAELVRLARFSLSRLGGVDVVTTTDGAAGLREAERSAPDAILLDIMMPRMDGLAVLDALRSNAKTRAIPVVFLSAKQAALRSVAAMRSRGVIGTIEKPFDVNTLPRVLGELLADYDRAVVAEINEAFLQASALRLQEADRMLGILNRDPTDRDAIAALGEVFHKLAGSAGTFGHSSVSVAACKAEEECDRVLISGGTAAGLLRKCRETVEAMREQLFGARRGESGRREAGRASVLVVASFQPQLGEAIDLLRAAGFAVQVAETAREARAALQDAVPDVLVVGRSIIGAEAYEVIDQLRIAPQGPRAAVIVVGGPQPRLPDSLQDTRRDVGVVLPVPFDAWSIVGAVRYHAQRKHSDVSMILCAGFDAETAQLIGSIAESVGYRVRVAESLKHLDADIDAFEPDLIVAGPSCGEFGAADVTRHVQLVRPAGTLPVIVVGVGAIESARCGADGSLDMPLSPPLLLAVMASRIDHARVIRFVVSRDPVTGELNERAFADRAARALRERRDPFVLVALGLPSSATEVNLVALATTLHDRLRETDVIGVSGRRELLALLEGIDAANARTLFVGLAAEFAGLSGIEIDFGIADGGGVTAFDEWRQCAENARIGRQGVPPASEA